MIWQPDVHVRRFRARPGAAVVVIPIGVQAKAGMPVQIKKSSTVIPRNSHIEANQSGLIAEPLIDITPQLPIPDYKVICMLSLHPIPADASRLPAPQLAINLNPACKPHTGLRASLTSDLG